MIHCMVVDDIVEVDEEMMTHFRKIKAMNEVRSMENPMSRKDTPVAVIKLTGSFIRETNAAVLFKFCIETDDGGDGENHIEWFPLSQVTKIYKAGPNSPVYQKDELTVARWLVEKKGLVS